MKKSDNPLEYLTKHIAWKGDCIEWTKVSTFEHWPELGDTTQVYRIFYSLFVGPLLHGMDIDHTCHNRRCVNVKHLRQITHKQNMENRKGAPKNSRTGVRGVFLTPSGTYQVRVTHHYKTHCFGTFTTLEEAGTVAKAARQKLHSHSSN